MVLLSVGGEAICLANFLSSACCVTQLNVSLTCHAVFQKFGELVSLTEVFTWGVFLKEIPRLNSWNRKNPKSDFATVSLLNRSIQDLSDHGASKELKNSLKSEFFSFFNTP